MVPAPRLPNTGPPPAATAATRPWQSPAPLPQPDLRLLRPFSLHVRRTPRAPAHLLGLTSDPAAPGRAIWQTRAPRPHSRTDGSPGPTIGSAYGEVWSGRAIGLLAWPRTP